MNNEERYEEGVKQFAYHTVLFFDVLRAHGLTREEATNITAVFTEATIHAQVESDKARRRRAAAFYEKFKEGETE